MHTRLGSGPEVRGEIGMSEPITTFARLLDPISVEEFFADYYDKQALHIPGTPEKVAGICSWDSFNDLLHRWMLGL